MVWINRVKPAPIEITRSATATATVESGAIQPASALRQTALDADMTGLGELRWPPRLLEDSQFRSGYSSDTIVKLAAPMHPTPDDLDEINDHQLRDDT